MTKIIGNTTATPNPRPDWNQIDETKADYIKNKPKILTEEEIIQIVEDKGGDITVDTELSNESENPVQNKVIKEALDGKLGTTETANSSKTIDGLVRLDYEGNEELFEWYAPELQAEGNRPLFELDTNEDAELKGGIAFVEVHNKTGKNPALSLAIDGDMFVKEGKEKVATKSDLENIKVDTELSTESTNFVQNKVITEALDGKVDKITPGISTDPKIYAYTRTRSGKSDGSIIDDCLFEVSQSATTNTIALRGTDGTLRVGNPTVGQHAVPYSYLGHRYKFTCSNGVNVAFGGGEDSTMVFYHNTKSQFNLEILSQELKNQNIVFTGYYAPYASIDIQEGTLIGSLSVSSIVISGENSLSITTTSSVGLYSSGITQSYTMFAGTFTFTVEQIY